MVSRETRVYLAGFALTAAFAVAFAVASALGSGGWVEGPLAVLAITLIFPVLPFLVPQLYLAVTGSESEDVPPRTRIRISLLVSGLVPLGLYSTMDAGQTGRWLAGGIAAFLLGSLFVHEMVVGYRSSSLFANAE